MFFGAMSAGRGVMGGHRTPSTELTVSRACRRLPYLVSMLRAGTSKLTPSENFTVRGLSLPLNAT